MRHEQWLYFKGTLDSQWCDDFVQYCTDSYEPVESTIGFNKQSAKSDSFDVDVRYINELQFTTYKGKNEGRYGWHHDVDFKNPHPYHRKLSLTLQLSDPKDYEGGEFEFESGIDELPEEYREKGTILIFPSFYKHQVKPVTKGTRHSLVTWVEGPHWR